MTLGEKLRQVRTERGLSQKQVAGTYMTRNMLSQLENDQASPSVKTLSYLSDVLQVSMSWLLEDGPRSGSSQITERARNDYLDGNYRACLDSLVGIDQKSEEDQLLMCRSSLAYGLECFENGNFSEAENAAQTALSCHGPYITELDYLQAKHLLCRCALIQSEPADDRIIMFQEDYERYLQNWDPTLLLIWQSLTQKRLDDARMLLSGAERINSGMYNYFQGWYLAEVSDVEGALIALKQAESDVLLPRPCRMEVFRLLETCYKEKENYLQAYRYAVLQRDG